MIISGPSLPDVRREADQILYSDPDVQGWKDLAEDVCVIVAKTLITPIVRMSTSGESEGEPSTPPSVSLKVMLKEPRRDLQVFRCFLVAERMRDYLAYATGVCVPIRHVFVGKTLLFPGEFSFNPQAYLPTEVLVGTKNYSDWADGILPMMTEAKRLLTAIEDGTPLDRAINLVGRAITTADRESSFLYCWRAIESISAMDLEAARERARTGDVRAGDAYVSGQLNQFLKGEQEILLSIAQRCYVTLEARVPGFDIKKGREWYKLRGKVAHAGLSAEDYRAVLQSAGEVFGLAKTCVASKLTEMEKASHRALPL
ncbi:MAG: hypothetical protein WCB18_09480 [Thermoplasmata archaeon]